MNELKQVSEAESPAAENATLAASNKVPDISKFLLPGAILIASVMIAGAVLYTKAPRSVAPLGNQPEQGQVVKVSPDDDPSLGNKNAPITMIEFSDFQCPFCRAFWRDTLPQLKKEYIDTGKVRLVYRDYPLSIHPGALPAAMAAECADDQGKFWEYHDKIFTEEDKGGTGTVPFGAPELKKWAKDLGLDTGKFNSCLDSSKYKGEVDKDTADGNTAGVSGTPSFFINGRLLVGAQPFAQFKTVIDAALNK